MKPRRIGSFAIQQSMRETLDTVGIRGELRVITRHGRDEAALVPMDVLEDWLVIQETPALKDALEEPMRVHVSRLSGTLRR